MHWSLRCVILGFTPSGETTVTAGSVFGPEGIPRDQEN